MFSFSKYEMNHFFHLDEEKKILFDKLFSFCSWKYFEILGSVHSLAHHRSITLDEKTNEKIVTMFLQEELSTKKRKELISAF